MPDSPVPPQVQALAQQLAQTQPMRRGSVSERYVKCGKPGCPCNEDPQARHGPYYSVSRVVKGRTRSRWLSGEEAEMVRQQVQAAHEFRERLESYWQACEAWADSHLEAAAEATSQGEAKKGASKRRSRRRS